MIEAPNDAKSPDEVEAYECAPCRGGFDIASLYWDPDPEDWRCVDCHSRRPEGHTRVVNHFESLYGWVLRVVL